MKLPAKEKQAIRRLQSEINQEILSLDALLLELKPLKPRLSPKKVSNLDLRAGVPSSMIFIMVLKIFSDG